MTESIVRTEGFAVEHRRLEVDGVGYAWSVLVPVSAGDGPSAGLLFLHGSGECGTDGMLPLRVGLVPAIERAPERWPFVVVVPQKPVRSSEWEDHERAVLAMLDGLVAEGLVDPSRVAITGLSQGGHGTIALASRHPGRFRAAAAVCGYVDRRFSADRQRVSDDGATTEDPGVLEAAAALRDTPLWLYHGVLDPVIPISESRSLHAALQSSTRATGAVCRLTEIAGAEHNAWDTAYADPELAAWLRACVGAD